MRRAVGIDLGTSNTVVAWSAVDGSGDVAVFPIPQLVGPSEVEARELYPSLLFAPPEAELVADPWSERPWVSGEQARRRGAEVPGRLVSSAKSWLCHPGVDRRAAILPVRTDDASLPRISPVAVSALLLGHVKKAWDAAFPDAPLSEQSVVLTVPASFDEVARELTLEAARDAGLSPVLLEEPIAAFYDYLGHDEELRALLRERGEVSVLVCDVGGGTTDLSLVSCAHGDTLRPERRAVGRHLLLGGDNMDLALAHALEGRFVAASQRLAPGSFAQLVAACRSGKEQLLGPDAPDAVTLRIAEAGARLVGGIRTATLTREDVVTIVLEGFFPSTFAEAAPRRGALVGFGLPYEADTAVPRHVLSFVKKHAPDGVDAVLFNGGVFAARVLADRLLATLSLHAKRPVVELPHADPDRAVARGATRHALARAGVGIAIGAKTVRGYYVAVESKGRTKAVCVVPRGAQEGQSFDLADAAFVLTVGKPVRFDLYVSERSDALGTVVELGEDFERLPPLTVALDQADLRRRAEDVPVVLAGELGATGTLALRCVEQGGAGRTFALRFELQRGPSASLPPPSQAPSDPRLASAKEALAKVFGKTASNEGKLAKELPKELERILGERSTWTGPLLRALFDALTESPGARKRSVEHERIFFSLAGYTLRPGFGDPGDPARVNLFERLFAERLSFPDETRGWQQFFVAYRRMSGGLPAETQERLRTTLDPFVAPRSAGLARSKKMGSIPEGAEAELVDLLSSLERVSASRRAALGEWLLDRALGSRSPHPWIALGRVGAREPTYGSTDDVVAPTVVERWIEQLLRQKWEALPAAPAIAVRLARVTGDRSRDVSIRVQKDLERKLVASGAKEDVLRALREHVPLADADRAELFGDALPLGLRWSE